MEKRDDGEKRRGWFNGAILRMAWIAESRRLVRAGSRTENNSLLSGSPEQAEMIVLANSMD